MAAEPGAFRLRLVRARRRRAGDRLDRARDDGDLSDHALPPGDRGADGRDDGGVSGERFTLGLGAGERHRGEHFTVEDARVFDLPDAPIDVYLAAGGPRAARLAASVDAGVCATGPDEVVVEAYTGAGGGADRTWGQVVLAWAGDEHAGLADAHAQFRFAAGGWKVQSELPNPVNFAAATQTLDPADLAEAIPAGPDPAVHADAVPAFLDLGYEHIAVAYPGDDPEGLMRFFQNEVRPLV